MAAEPNVEDERHGEEAFALPGLERIVRGVLVIPTHFGLSHTDAIGTCNQRGHISFVTSVQ